MVWRKITSPRGTVYYWIARHRDPQAICLVFTHGLTANHRMFDHQVACFRKHYTVISWDLPLPRELPVPMRIFVSPCRRRSGCHPDSGKYSRGGADRPVAGGLSLSASRAISGQGAGLCRGRHLAVWPFLLFPVGPLLGAPGGVDVPLLPP